MGPLANTDTITPLALPIDADRSVQFEGTFGAAGVFALQGSNDGVTYHTLHDPLGNAISTGVSALFQVSENTWYIAPLITGAMARPRSRSRSCPAARCNNDALLSPRSTHFLF